MKAGGHVAEEGREAASERTTAGRLRAINDIHSLSVCIHCLSAFIGCIAFYNISAHREAPSALGLSLKGWSCNCAAAARLTHTHTHTHTRTHTHTGGGRRPTIRP
eukprot:GHVU01042321.1.p1 GENE.GHVU01042321.1~~GHVU01042321.1.p1  ORF type:complete len:105 (-),score=10.95 GHVU01042321.1:125-439(-)